MNSGLIEKQACENGGIGLLAYGLILLLLLPAGAALACLLLPNSLYRRAAVAFMAAALIGITVMLALQGGGTYQPPAKLLQALRLLFFAGNLAILATTAWLGWRWKSFGLMGLAILQSAVLGWLCLTAEPGVLLPGAFFLDHLSLALLFLFNCAGPLALFAVVRQGREAGIPARSLAAAVLLISAMNGLAMSGQLLWIFFFWQFAMLLSLLAVIRGRIGTAGRFMANAAIIHALGGFAFLGGAVLCLRTAGTLQIRELLLVGEALTLLLPLALFFLAGLAGAAQYPFQGGLLRSASLASAPVSAFLQGATVLNAGMYLILRLSPLFMNTWLAKAAMLLGAFSFAAGALLALLQHELKRGLTYSTVSILGLGIALACMADMQAIYAAVWVVVFHGLAKTLLFLCADGQERHPISGGCLIAAAVSMIMPPFGVPMGLWTAIEGAVRQPAALACLIAGGLIHLLFWAQVVGTELSKTPMSCRAWKDAFKCCRKHTILGAAILLVCMFQIPLTQRFLAPILKENFSRFGDVAQAEVQSFFVETFSGVNPGLLLLAVATGGLILWALLQRFFSGDQEVGKQQEAEPQALTSLAPEAGIEPEVAAVTEVSTIIEAETVTDTAAVRDEADGTAAPLRTEKVLLTVVPMNLSGALLPWLPVRRRLELYCSLMAAGLIFLMLEVVAR